MLFQEGHYVKEPKYSHIYSAHVKAGMLLLAGSGFIQCQEKLVRR